MAAHSLPFTDLDHVLAHAGDALRELSGERVFLTGGTAFFGAWLTESFLWANARLGLRAQLTVLTRDPDGFRRRVPQLAGHDALTLLTGDATRFEFPEGRFGCVVHAATEPQLPELPADELLARNVAATRRVLGFASAAGAARVLFTSSGAVYGTQPPALHHVPEDYTGAPDPSDPRSAYGQSKRVSEELCLAANAEHGLQVAIARCFAFVGPYLPLDANFAVGNFMRDALAGRAIVVQGDGTPRRSYLHAADLAIWLWTILLRGRAGRAYNVGSEHDVSIAELAAQVQSASGQSCRVEVRRPSASASPPARYVPATTRAADELGLHTWIALPEALSRTFEWLRARPPSPGPT